MSVRHASVQALHVSVQVLPHGKGLDLPVAATAGSAGLDLRAAIDEPIVLGPGERGLVPTGLRFALPVGYEGQIRPRSGLALRHGVTVLNSPGTLDADYRGELKVLLVNLGQEAFEITRGSRIAQLVLAPVSAAVLVEVAAVDETERAGGGFGSTGAS